MLWEKTKVNSSEVSIYLRFDFGYVSLTQLCKGILIKFIFSHSGHLCVVYKTQKDEGNQEQSVSDWLEGKYEF